VNNTAEQKTAAQLFFGRHPELKDLLAGNLAFYYRMSLKVVYQKDDIVLFIYIDYGLIDHGFFFAKLIVDTIIILNNYGNGPINITVENYFHPPVYHAVNKLYEHSFVEHRV